MKFWTGLCPDDVTTSSGDVISRNKLHSHMRGGKVLGKVTKGISEISHGSGVHAAKSRSGGKFTPPPGSMKVNLCNLSYARSVTITQK